jgi:P22 coat protein - gene protein 5
VANLKLNTLEIMFEEFTNSYDLNTTISRKAGKFYPKPKDMERGNDTYFVKQELMLTTIENTFDISGSPKSDIIERAIPITFRNPDNVLYELTAKEMRDPDKMRDAGKAAAKKLASTVDRILYSTVALQASIVVKKVGAFTWDDGAIAEAALVQRGYESSDLSLFLNAQDYLSVAKDLGNRAYLGDRSKDAYERSKVPDIANFQTFRTGNQYNLAAVGTVTGTTVSGAQSFTPTSMTGNLPTDNRQMTLVVAGANIANTKVGDCFTIAGVNSVHAGDKSDTNSLQTFRILSGAGTANLVITPAIIATGAYQNATAVAGAGAAIVFLNTATKPVNPFWSEGAVFLDYGKLEFPDGYGPKVMQSTTEQGVPLQISAFFNHLTGKVEIRNHVMFAATVREREQCGIIIANQ